VRALKESLRLTEETGNQLFHIRVLGTLGYEALEAGEISAARPYLEQALYLLRNTDDPTALTAGTLNLGFASYLEGAGPAAREHFEEGLRIAKRNGDQYMVAHAQLGLALITARAGDASGAAALHGAADAVQERLGARFVWVEARLRDAGIAALRTTLGDAEFERAYNTGRAIQPSNEPALD
jgi:tetratricopeptide (TPR) repeat protein